MKRRKFLKTTAAAGCAWSGLFGYAMPGVEAFGTGGGIDIAEALMLIEQRKQHNLTPEIRPEIRDNPRAVFIIDTHVEATRDDRGFFSDARSQLEEAGKQAARQVFVKGSRKGGSTIIRPNFTDVPDPVLSPVCGINTSCDFIGGFTDSLREMGNTNVIAGSRGGGVVTHRRNGIYDAFDRHGLDLIEAKYRRFQHYGKNELNWHEVRGKAMVQKRFPTYRPIGDEDCFFINMPKLKCHNLGLTTLSIKNLQGAVPTGYGHYCNNWATMEYLCKRSYLINFRRDFVKNYYRNVEAAFLKHRDMGYKHWDVEGTYAMYEKKGGWEAFRKIKDDIRAVEEFLKGVPKPFVDDEDFQSSVPGVLMWDEQWCQRAIDSALAITPDINIIEGIIGRDGSGFDTGRDELCNYVVIGLSMTEVDAIGTWIMGHDPRELFYTRIAKERGLGECNPEKITVYFIRNGEITPMRDLSELRRYKLGVNLHTWKETGKRLFW
ncbi:MAG: DUF362 domain-containing protein [Candidatus Latescibacteria bacterium]|nr:DUF362 domain-containing protein [Candidatus Latescibacterota bacterium]